MKKIIAASLLVLFVASFSMGCIGRDVEARVPSTPDGFYVVKENWFSGEDNGLASQYGVENGVVIEYSVCPSGGWRCKHIILHVYEFKNIDRAEAYEEQVNRFGNELFKRDGKYVAYAITTSLGDKKVKQLAIDMVEYAT